MGITQHSHGSDNVFSIANLALMTGNLGKASSGVNPLRGQNNVQGSTDMGCSPDSFPGYQKVDNPAARERFERLWGVNLSPRPGLKASEMVFEAEAGNLKALYIMGENPVLSDPDVHHTIEALKKLELLVVQDIFMTETAELAHVVLPAASFAEKDGTFTNTERRVQRVRRAVKPPGEAREDSWIIMELSKRLGYEMPYNNIEEVFQEIGMAWPAMAGMTYSRLENGGLQWPCPTTDHPGTKYLFKGGFPRGKARFTVVKYRPPVEDPDEEYPFILTTGRLLFQYHTGTMTRRVNPIEEVAGTPYVEINRDDALSLGIKDGDRVRVSSRRGEIE
ncbi:MAG: formate dehydrogenase subunit alpha, partial [Nitrospirae bacterium]